VLQKSLNGAALGGRVTALEQKHVPDTGAFAVFLRLQQLNLQAPFRVLIFVARHPVAVWIPLPPGVDIQALSVEQDRIVIILVVNGVPVFGGRKGLQIYFCHRSTL
jgi:hypothetical protein